MELRLLAKSWLTHQPLWGYLDRLSIIQLIMDSLMWSSFLGEMRGLRTSIFALLYLQAKATTKYNSNDAWRSTRYCREKYQKYCCYTLGWGETASFSLSYLQPLLWCGELKECFGYYDKKRTLSCWFVHISVRLIHSSQILNLLPSEVLFKNLVCEAIILEIWFSSTQMRQLQWIFFYRSQIQLLLLWVV